MKKKTTKFKTVFAKWSLHLMACLFLSFNSYSQSVTMSFLPGGVDNCGNPLPNAGTYTLSGTVNGKNAYFKGTNLKIIWTGTQWELQAKDPCCGSGFLTQWYNTANTPTMPPATCWQASFGCFPIQLSGPDAVNITPAVSVQPSNSTICSGNNTSFGITTTGSLLTYQWQVSTDGGSTFSNLSNTGVYTNVTTATMNITGATSGMNAYQYQCVVNGPCATATSNAGTLTVNGTPAVSVQPSNSTVCLGSNTSFAVTATGTSLTYQWQVSTNGGSTFSNLSNGGVYSNVTAATMNITSATAGMNAYQYKCVISGTCAPAATSNAVTLTINAAPAISGQPSNSTICAGNNTSFGITATGTSLTYQWQVSTNGGSTFSNLSNGGVYSNVTAATMNITGATSGLNAYQYKCIVSGTCAPSATSNAVTLTINALPSISVQPANSTICSGNNTSFAVTATGTGISYQWQVSTNGGSTFNNLSNFGGYGNVTTATMNIIGASSGLNGYQYKCVVSGSCAPAANSNAVTLTVNTTPSIINTYPASSCGTGSLTLNALADLGTINWYDAPGGGTLLGSGSSFTTPSISNSTTYYVDATSNGCTTPSRTGVLATINPLPPVSISGTSTICHGTSTSLIASGADTYTWSSGVNAITPPLDVVSTAKLAVGLHKLQSSYTGNAVRIRRAFDNVEQDFGFVGNDLDAASIATFLNGSDGYCTTLYDQSGNGNDVVQTNTGNQPLYVSSSAMNLKPALNFSSSQYMTNSFTHATPYSVVYGAQQTGPNRQRMLSTINNNWLLGWWGGSQTQAYFEGWVNNPSTPAGSNYLVYSCTGDGINSSVYENGTSIATNSNGLAAPDGISLNQSGLYGEQSDGNWTDVIVFSSVLSNTDRSTVENSILGYYGTMATVSPTSNTTYTVTGIYTTTGCVNTTTVSVNIATSASTQTLTKCAGQSVTVGTSTYTASGTYTDVLSSVLTGCDSTVTTNLTVLPANTFTQSPTICAGASLTVGTSTYTTSGNYNDILTSVATGCDSTVTTNLTVLPANTYTQTRNACAGMSVTVGTSTYTTSGTYTDVLTSVLTGCDSTVTTNLTVLAAITSTQTLTKCAGQSVTVGTHTYTTSGTYTDVLPAVLIDCDSTVTTNLTVLAAITSTQTITKCAGQSVTVGIHTYTTSGTYTDVLTSVSTGCDSTVTTNLTVNNAINTSVTVNSPTITANNATATSYQWMDCNPPNPLIPGATHQSYVAIANGNYEVVITEGSCTATSTCITISNIGIEKYNATNNLQVYPNPFNNELTIVSTAKTNAILFDMLGNKINEFVLQNTTQTISLGDLAPGMYYLQVDNSKIKIIKQ